MKLDTIGIGESFLVPICIYSGIKVGYKIEQKNSEKVKIFILKIIWENIIFEEASTIRKWHCLIIGHIFAFNWVEKFESGSNIIDHLSANSKTNWWKNQSEFNLNGKNNLNIFKIKLISPEFDQIMPKENKSEEIPKIGIWMDPEKQILKWTMELKGKEEKKFRIQYELEYPIDKRIRIAQN